MKKDNTCPKCGKPTEKYKINPRYGQIYVCENCQQPNSRDDSLNPLLWGWDSSRIWENPWEEGNEKPCLVKVIIDRALID